MAFISQPPFVGKILKALGLDEHKVRGLSLHMRVNDLVTAEVEMLPSADQMSGVAEALEVKRFLLTELPEGHDA